MPAGLIASLPIAVARSLEDWLPLDRPFNGPTLSVGWFGGLLRIGPLFGSYNSICPRCARYWARTSEDPDAAESDSGQGSSIDSLVETHTGGDSSRLASAVIVVDCVSGTSTVHQLVPLSNCRMCASLPQRGSSDLEAHASSRYGIVRRVVESGQTELGLHFATATSIAPPSTKALRRDTKLTQTFGAADSRDGARVCGIAEAIETYSSIFRGNESLRWGTQRDVRGIDPRELMLFSREEYRQRETRNAQNVPRYQIPEAYSESSPIRWVRGRAVWDGSPAWIPAACCYTQYVPNTAEIAFGSAGNSGCASGPTFEGALVTALLESIERDAAAIWWYNRLVLPQVSPLALRDPALDRVCFRLTQLGLDFRLLNLTHDLGVPVFAAVIANADGSRPVFGTACAQSPQIAARKALWEAALHWRLSMLPELENSDIRHWIQTATLHNQPYLQGGSEGDPPSRSDDGGDPLAGLIGRFRSAGLSPYLVNLTRPDTLLYTVRAVVPKLRRFGAGLGPGRLYDVPVQMGWLPQPTAESNLNPIHCIF